MASSAIELPRTFAPMLAVTEPVPTDEEGWAWEPKWDGWRVLVRAEGGQIKVLTRKGRNIAAQLPELEPLAGPLGHRKALLDGELVAFGPDGRPDFGRLSVRLIGNSPRLAARGAAEVPVTWVAFDACYLDGASLLDQPYCVRRAALEDLDLRGPAWAPTPASLGEGLRMLRAARQHELEGVVAKRLSSRYLPGRRSRSWVKVKRFHRATLVVTGWVPWPGRRSGPLALGYFCPVLDGGPSEVRFAGMVETGFSEDDRLALGERLAELQDERAVPWRSHRGQAVYPVPPKLRVEVQLLEWTAQGQARHLSYKGVASSAP